MYFTIICLSSYFNHFIFICKAKSCITKQTNWVSAVYNIKSITIMSELLVGWHAQNHLTLVSFLYL